MVMDANRMRMEAQAREISRKRRQKLVQKITPTPVSSATASQIVRKEFVHSQQSK